MIKHNKIREFLLSFNFDYFKHEFDKEELEISIKNDKCKIYVNYYCKRTGYLVINREYYKFRLSISIYDGGKFWTGLTTTNGLYFDTEDEVIENIIELLKYEKFMKNIIRERKLERITNES